MSVSKLLFRNYDVADTSYTYGYFSDPINSPKYMKTSGSSTTFSEFVSGDKTFSWAANGDLIEYRPGADAASVERIVTDATLAPTSVVVDTASTLTSQAFSFRKLVSGQAAGSAWFRVGEFNEKVLQVNIGTPHVATSIDVILEGRIGAGDALNSVTLWSKSYTLTGSDAVPIIEDVDEIRVGFKLTGADSGTNLVYAYFRGDLKRR